MNESHNVLAIKLKELRKSKRMTQEDISKLLEMDRSNIANYERGKRLPPIEVLIKIANFYEVSLDYLILGKNSSEDSYLKINNEGIREILAENTILIDTELKLSKELLAKEKEIEALKQVNKSLQEYNQVLENKIKTQSTSTKTNE